MGHKCLASGTLQGLHTVGHVTLDPGVTPQACPRGSVGTTNRLGMPHGRVGPHRTLWMPARSLIHGTMTRLFINHPVYIPNTTLTLPKNQLCGTSSPPAPALQCPLSEYAGARFLNSDSEPGGETEAHTGQNWAFLELEQP